MREDICLWLKYMTPAGLVPIQNKVPEKTSLWGVAPSVRGSQFKQQVHITAFHAELCQERWNFARHPPDTDKIAYANVRPQSLWLKAVGWTWQDQKESIQDSTNMKDSALTAPASSPCMLNTNPRRWLGHCWGC